MADAKLTITVSADVKKAAQQLKSLGYNIQDVKKDTDKANSSASVWSQTLKKGAQDNVQQLIALGARFLTLTTVVSFAYKGIKSCVSEALKENKEAQEKIDKINAAWTEVKKNLGTALLDSVTPALEGLLTILNKITAWTEKSKKNADFNSIAKAAYNGYKGGGVDFSPYSLESLKYFQSSYEDLFNNGYEGWVTNAGENASQMYYDVKAVLDAEIAAREALAKATTTGTGGAAGGSPGSSGGNNGLETYNELSTVGSASWWLPHANKQLEKAKSLLSEYQAEAAAYTGEDNYWQKSVEWVENYIDELKEANEAQTELINNISLLGTEAMNIWSGISELLDQTTENEIKNIEKSTASQEEKDLRIEELERKQFDRQKRLSLAEAAMSAAQAMLEIYAKYSATPWLMWSLLGTTAVSTGLEIATISQQNFAQGGIVSGPTQALIGEGGEKEAVMPLSKLEDFVSRPEQSGTIVINVSINGSGNGTAEDVYYAIERAQRTGLLPKWRYA